MVKSQHNPGMVINTDLIETIQVEIDTSATIESEDTPYIVYAQFISGHSIIIERFETEAEAIEYVNGFTENYERSENTMTENIRIELCPFCGEKEEVLDE